VADSCTIVIGPPDFLPDLKARAGGINGEVLAFTDLETLQALEEITKRKPSVVALERVFAVTPRGAALILRIKSDPTLHASEIRVLEHNSDYSRVIPRSGGALTEPSLDQRGTRRAPRLKIKDKVTVLVDGKTAVLIDLSTVGAQAVSSGALKPDQRVDMVFKDNIEKVSCVATVIWTSFEMAASGPRYRAGLDFMDADTGPIGAYAQRHKA
jgi:hypothetical protein